MAPDPLGTSLSKAGSSPPASPCGAEHDRQPPWGQTHSTLRSWVYENKEREGKSQSDPSVHQLLSQGLLKKQVSRSLVKLKCLEKPKEVEAASPSKGCVLLPPTPDLPPGKSLNPLFFLQESDRIKTSTQKKIL